MKSKVIFNNKLLLYKTVRGFTRFIKATYKNNFEIVYCDNTNLHEIRNESFIATFVTIENEEDLACLGLIFQKTEKVFIVSNLSNYNDTLVNNFNNIIVLNHEIFRKQFVEIVNTYLKSIPQLKK